MRERLAIAFVVGSLLLVAISFTIRSVTLTNNLRAAESATLGVIAGDVAAAVRGQEEAGRPVDAAYLAELASPYTEIVYHVPSRPNVSVAGPGFAPGETPEAWAAHETGHGTVVLRADRGIVHGLLYPSWRTSVLVILLLVVVSGLVGYLFANRLARPFRQLAGAAADLGRGRFDLVVPESRVREVRTLSTALRDSAASLRQRLARERALAAHTSHALRTPLTALRLELEDLRGQDLPVSVGESVDRSICRIDQLDGVTGELVELARGTSLVSGAAITLRELAAATAQRWADELAQQDRAVTAVVEGDLETTYTPGPVEQILDLVLVDVMRRSRGAVRLVYEAGEDAHLRIGIEWAHTRTSRGVPAGRADGPLVRARAVATALGGLLEEGAGQAIWIRLPRR